MVRSEEKLVNGSVTAYKIRRSTSDQWAHEYTVGSQVYTHFSMYDVALMRVGDTVRFLAAAKRQKKRRNRYCTIDELSIEVLSTLTAQGSDRGYLYVLVHPAMKGLRKIGFTRGSPQARADALSGNTGVPGKYSVEWAMPVCGDPQRIERAVHAALSKQRYEKEFFRVGQNEAREAIQLAYADLYPQAVAEIEQGLRARVIAVGQARKEAQARLRAEREQRTAERRRVTPEFKWLQSGTLVVHVQTEFYGSAVPESKPNLLQRLIGKVPETPERISVEIEAKQAGTLWELRIDGWLRGSRCQRSVSAQSLESAVETLGSFLKDQPPQRMNVMLRIPTAALDDPSDPPAGRLNANGLVLEVRGAEVANYRLKRGDLQAACVRVRAITGKAELMPSLPRQESKKVDSRGRPRYPFGSKARARDLLRSSGMSDREIEIYLDQFAD